MIDVGIQEETTVAYMNVVQSWGFLGTEAGCEHQGMVPAYIDNLIRLGLIESPKGQHYSDDEAYEEILSHAEVVEAVDGINKMEGKKVRITKRLVDLTAFGKQFFEACLVDHDQLIARVVE